MLEEAPEKVAGVLNLIGERIETGAVLFHCTAGKDRTGVTAAMLYLICGVDDVDIIADYQVTETYQEKNPMFAYAPKEIMPLLNSNPENMKYFLKNAREKDYLQLLRDNGLKKENEEKIKRNAINLL